MSDNKYTYSFMEAVEICLSGKAFIRGENFRPGTYVTVDSMGVLVVKEKNSWESSNLLITKGVISQKYKVFRVLTDAELELK